MAEDTLTRVANHHPRIASSAISTPRRYAITKPRVRSAGRPSQGSMTRQAAIDRNPLQSSGSTCWPFALTCWEAASASCARFRLLNPLGTTSLDPPPPRAARARSWPAAQRERGSPTRRQCSTGPPRSRRTSISTRDATRLPVYWSRAEQSWAFVREVSPPFRGPARRATARLP